LAVRDARWLLDSCRQTGGGGVGLHGSTMEILITLVILAEVWLFTKLSAARKETAETREEMKRLMGRLKELKDEVREMKVAPPPAAPTPRAQEEVVAETPVDIDEFLRNLEARKGQAAAIQVPPPLPVVEETTEEWQAPVAPRVPATPRVAVEEKEPFSLERFMGVKLFAWLGGVAMFFGVIFFVKYAFEKNLISPPLRVAMGYVMGGGLLAGGLWSHRLPRYRVLAQAFCATGVLILYGVTFAAHAIYHFPAFGTVSTLVIMAVVTAAAFIIAVRLDALVVAVLGMLGGFLTPVLLSTGQDQVFGLFGYIALLDIGLVAVSRKKRWDFLTSSAAVGTALMQIGWFGKFFETGAYDVGPKTLVPMGILLFFSALFLAGGWIGRKCREMDFHAVGAVLTLAAVAIAFGFVMLGYDQVAERYFLLYGFLLLVQLPVIALVMVRPDLGMAQVVAAGLVFFHLACWTMRELTSENLNGMLAVYLIFGALHAVVPVLLARRPDAMPAKWPMKAGPWFAPLVVLLMLLPVVRLEPVSMVIWAAILMADLLAIGLALATGAVVSVLVSLLLTMGVAALWLLKGPSSGDSLMPFLGVITGFSAVFSVAGKFLARGNSEREGAQTLDQQVAGFLPVVSAIVPFAMLILALLRLPVVDPSPVFGVALLMSALLGGLAIFGKQGPLVLAALIGTLAVEAVWHLHYFRPETPMVALSWYLGFYGLFLVFPFVFRRAFASQAVPWIASALSGVGHFLLVHQLVKHAFPNEVMGLLPAAFAVPALAALVVVTRWGGEMDAQRRSQLAWFGGVALLFITLIFPIQFDRQWLTVSWAMEGALLLWLFRKVPHPGLQLTGLALLAISFIRLTLNPAVFLDYPRSGTAILNWHLYAYGLVAVAQFFGAHWFTDPEGQWKGISPRGVLYGLGGVLLFLLLNIEIADYFTAPGDRCVAFSFGGNFARDMSYSIGWGLFSLGLLGIGIWRKSKHARFAAIGLLVVTLLKVFLHDLANIESIFRIGALIGVAVIAFVASFLYQRFFERTEPS